MSLLLFQVPSYAHVNNFAIIIKYDWLVHKNPENLFFLCCQIGQVVETKNHSGYESKFNGATFILNHNSYMPLTTVL